MLGRTLANLGEVHIGEYWSNSLKEAITILSLVLPGLPLSLWLLYHRLLHFMQGQCKPLMTTVITPWIRP